MTIQEVFESDLAWIPLSIIPVEYMESINSFLIDQTLSMRKTAQSRGKLESHMNGEDFKEWYEDNMMFFE